MTYDVAIIGGGAAGMTAGTYSARLGLKTILFEKTFPGGQANKALELDNYPGLTQTTRGSDLMENFRLQAKKFGVEFENSEVAGVELMGHQKKIMTSKQFFLANTVILAMGARPRELGLDGERRLLGAGVSYCATCDGAFFKNKRVAVIGGGNTAIWDVLFLSNICKKVYLIHRRNEFRADKILVERLSQGNMAELVLNSVVTDIWGDEVVSGVTVQNVQTLEQTTLNLDGVFIAAGIAPESELVSHAVELDKSGFILTDEHMRTSVDGVFAAGDIRATPLRQVITAASDGAIAAYSAAKYLA